MYISFQKDSVFSFLSKHEFIYLYHVNTCIHIQAIS